MIKLFEERCALCECKKNVSEGEYIFEGEIEELEDGETFPVPTFISSKALAKKWFKSHGWRYYNNLVYCGECFEQLKNGYVVLDRFNQIYDNEACLDLPQTSCVMSKEEAIAFSRYQYNNENVFHRKALGIVSKFLNGELESDVVGFIKAHPDVDITITSTFLERGFF